MRKVVGGICCLIVAMQILIGVPVVICLAFFILAPESIGNFEVELGASPMPPPVASPQMPVAVAPALPSDAPSLALAAPLDQTALETILAARAERGSVLADNTHFLTALERFSVAEETAPSLTTATTVLEVTEQPSDMQHVQPTVRLIYSLADESEAASRFDDADDWRRLAREIRSRFPGAMAGSAQHVAAPCAADGIARRQSPLPAVLPEAPKAEALPDSAN